MVLETRKRREHLSNDDLMKNKALLENFAKGNAQYLEQQQQTQNGENGEVSDRIQPKFAENFTKSKNSDFCLKFSFSEKATKIWSNLPQLLSNVKTLRTIKANFCGVLRKAELGNKYQKFWTCG